LPNRQPGCGSEEQLQRQLPDTRMPAPLMLPKLLALLIREDAGQLPSAERGAEHCAGTGQFRQVVEVHHYEAALVIELRRPAVVGRRTQRRYDIVPLVI